jgi:pathogenesis-related protein 1
VILRATLLALVGAASSGAAPSPAPAATAGDFENAGVYVGNHNAVRARVTKPAGYVGAWLPIPPLAWSDDLALSAQAWADHLKNDRKCKLEHSDTRNGENLAGGKGLDAAYAVRLWEAEGTKFKWVPVYEFDIPTGHYSQVVWRKTTFVGCARANCGSNVVVVCQYSPPGNHIGKSPY